MAPQSLALLADPYGPWCAWCLEYISRVPQRHGDALQYHHVAQRLLRGQGAMGPARYNWDAWVVPVHQRCHQSVLDRYSAAGGWLATLIVTNATNEPLKAERCAIDLFDAGLYVFCIVLHQALRRYYTTSAFDPDRQRYHFRAELICAAGVWFFVCPPLAALNRDPILAPKQSDNPDHVAFLMNPYGTFGRPRELGVLATRVTAILNGRGSEVVRARVARAQAYLTCADLTAAHRAEETARDLGAHQRRTARRVMSWAQLAANEHHAALDAEQSLQDFGDPSSFFEQMHADLLSAVVEYFAHGRCVGNAEMTRTIVKKLMKAQYLVACLGLKGWMNTHVPEVERLTFPWLSPGDFLFALVQQHSVRPEELHELREQAIGQSLKRRVWEAIASLGHM